MTGGLSIRLVSFGRDEIDKKEEDSRATMSEEA